MKRDMDLVRTILLEIERYPNPEGPGGILQIDNKDQKDVNYHVYLLHNAGLIVAADASSNGGLEWFPLRLTWAGHEFLDAARDDGIWQTAKDKVLSRVGSLSFETLKQLLLRLATEQLFS